MRVIGDAQAGLALIRSENCRGHELEEGEVFRELGAGCVQDARPRPDRFANTAQRRHRIGRNSIVVAQ